MMSGILKLSGLLGLLTQINVIGGYMKTTKSPTFISSYPTNITVQHGQSAFMTCGINDAQNKIITWIRKKDAYILSVDDSKLIEDTRYTIYKSKKDSYWTLQIKYVIEDDEGVYECQVSTEPKTSREYYLHVNVPEVSILAPKEVFVNVGSTVSLSCLIAKTLEDPKHTLWLHNSQQLLEVSDSRINIIKTKRNKTAYTVSLYISDVRMSDSGNYTCSPTGLDSAKVMLNVVSEKRPEELQHNLGSQPHPCLPSYLSSLAMFTSLLSSMAL